MKASTHTEVYRPFRGRLAPRRLRFVPLLTSCIKTATKRRLRPLWMLGAALLAAVVAKLFLVDLSALSGLPRVVAFLGVGILLLVIGFLSPLPPAAKADASRDGGRPGGH